MKKIIFKGPYHFNQIDHKEKNILGIEKIKLNVPGIYIWGFMYSKKDNTVFNSLDCKIETNKKYDGRNMQFIPYYVGKKTDSIFDRINEHYEVRSNSNSIKYTRLSYDYLKEFFKDHSFPINIGKSYINDFIRLGYENKVNYYNHLGFLCTKYRVNMNKLIKNGFVFKSILDVPIVDYNFLNDKDTLYNLVGKENYNNFWFCFAEFSCNKKLIKTYLESFETLTYYSLKGKTISKTQEFSKILNDIKIEDATNNSNIFNKDENGQICQIDFNNLLEIPGY
ncbi:hypothetical protein [Flavobacterium sp.]|uniref:hypothetical protein n=1 Tax=Flavobacterium sp. TaxID=239 RepID=UPI003BCDD84C